MTEAWTAWGERVEKRMSAQRATVENLATSLRQQLAKERAERIKLERELAMLKAELSTTRKLDDIIVASTRSKAHRRVVRDCAP